jgi:hypothetical protein
MPGSFMRDKLLLRDAEEPFQKPRPHPEEPAKRASRRMVPRAFLRRPRPSRRPCRPPQDEGSEGDAFETGAGC